MKSQFTSRAFVALFVATMALAPPPAWTQTQNGNVIGAITDPAGALISGAAVRATNQLTKAVRTVTSASDGTYLFQLLPAGTYTISAEMPGFKKFVNTDVVLLTNQELRVDVKLQLGEVATEVRVASEVAAIQTEASNISTDRDFTWITRAPQGPLNTVSFGPTNTVSSSGGYNGYNGTRQQQGTTTYDGVEFDFFRSYVTAYAVEEVKVEHTVAPAAYQTPVSVKLVSKGGTNTLHGRVNGSFANPALNALSNPRVHTRPAGLTNWQGGFNVNGPVYVPKLYDGRNRTFWSFGFTRQKNGNAPFPVTQIQPPQVWRRGDFSNPSLFSGTLRDPVTNAPFPGNIIPADRINPLARRLMSYYGTPINDTSTEVPIIMRWDDSSSESLYWRADQKLTDKHQLSVSYTTFKQAFTGQGFDDRNVYRWSGPFALKSTSPVYTLGLTSTLNPSMVNEARFGLHNDNGGYVSKPNPPTAQRIKDIGWTGIPDYPSDTPPSGPNVNVSGFFPFNGWASSPYHAYHWHFANNLSVHRGRHTLQTGIEHKYRAFDNNNLPNGGWGTMNLTGRFTGNAFGDFLLGLPETVSRQGIRPQQTSRNREWGLYVQDAWRVTTSLTLNFGIRWDYSSPLYDQRGFHFGFDQATGNIVVPSDESLKFVDPNWPRQRNPIVTASQAGLPVRLVRADRNNFYPRIGFAWRPGATDKFVVRGGYGVYIVPEFSTGTNTGGSNQLQWAGPFALDATYNNVDNSNPSRGAQPRFAWPVGIPDASLAGAPPLPSFTFTNPSFRYPYTQQANLTIERAVAGQRVRVSYILTKDTQLGYRRNINLPAPAPGLAFSDSRRPRQNFGNLFVLENGGSSTYHAGEAVLYLRKAWGFSGEVGLAWSKQISDIANARFEGLSGATSLNPSCRVCDRAETNVVPPIRQVSFLYWEVPYGRGKKFGGSINRLADLVAGGWELSTDIRFQKGIGVDAFYTGADPLGLGITSGRPDVVGDWRLPSGQRNEDNWFNRAAFKVPDNNIGRQGNAGRNIIRGPGLFNMDLGVFKSFYLVPEKSHHFLFTATITNPFNHIIFGYPPNNPSFSINTVTGSRLPGPIVGGRTIRLHLGYEF
ncbi:MAG: carboxypeptidase regulatory-like domain-containing protein [Bryobacteraceae bacterium]